MLNNDEANHGEVFTARLGISKRWDPVKKWKLDGLK